MNPFVEAKGLQLLLYSHKACHCGMQDVFSTAFVQKSVSIAPVLKLHPRLVEIL
jgi:hypothetical protein